MCGRECIWHSGTEMAVTTDHDDATTGYSEIDL